MARGPLSRCVISGAFSSCFGRFMWILGYETCLYFLHQRACCRNYAAAGVFLRLRSVRSIYRFFARRRTQGYIQHPPPSPSNHSPPSYIDPICISFSNKLVHKSNSSIKPVQQLRQFLFLKCLPLFVRQLTALTFYNLECISDYFATGYKLSGDSPVGAAVSRESQALARQ